MIRQAIAGVVAVLLGCVSLPSLAGTLPPYIVIDAESGKVLSSRDPHQPWAPASLTKMMTAYVIFEAIAADELKLSSPVKLSVEANSAAPVRSGLPLYTVLPLEDALKIMLVFSANDMAAAAAESLNGNVADFVARMNRTAERLGMADTRFANPNGLPADNQVSTARDLAILSQAVWRDFPAYHSYFGIGSVQVGSRTLNSGNDLIRNYQGTLGLKTGFTCASGYNVAALASRGNRTVIAVVLGAPSSASRAELSARLLERGFTADGEAELAAFVREPGPAKATADMSGRVCFGQRGKTEVDAALAGPSPLRVGQAALAPVKVSTGVIERPPGVKAPIKVSVASAVPRKAAAKATAEGDAAQAAAAAEEKKPAKFQYSVQYEPSRD